MTFLSWFWFWSAIRFVAKSNPTAPIFSTFFTITGGSEWDDHELSKLEMISNDHLFLENSFRRHRQDGCSFDHRYQELTSHPTCQLIHHRQHLQLHQLFDPFQQFLNGFHCCWEEWCLSSIDSYHLIWPCSDGSHLLSFTLVTLSALLLSTSIHQLISSTSLDLGVLHLVYNQIPIETV